MLHGGQLPPDAPLHLQARLQLRRLRRLLLSFAEGAALPPFLFGTAGLKELIQLLV
jgi:hypothetical protein